MGTATAKSERQRQEANSNYQLYGTLSERHARRLY
jgi:hypothetical protein